MAGFENQRNQEVDTAKLKLNDTKHVISEIQNKIQALQREREAGSLQHQKKMKNLSNIQATQYLRLTKLNGDITNAEQILHSRLAEHQGLLRLSEDNEKAIKATQEETDAMIADFHKRCRELEDSINDGYLQMRTDKDMEVLLEITRNILKDPATDLPHFYQILRDKREAILKLRQDINKELAQIDSTQTALAIDIQTKQHQLATAKQIHSTLADHLATIQKLGRLYRFTNTGPSQPNP